MVQHTQAFQEREALLEPFGLHFRQVLPLPTQPQMAQTTMEPEITTGDGNDPDKIDTDWIPDEDEDKDDDKDDRIGL